MAPNGFGGRGQGGGRGRGQQGAGGRGGRGGQQGFQQKQGGGQVQKQGAQKAGQPQKQAPAQGQKRGREEAAAEAAKRAKKVVEPEPESEEVSDDAEDDYDLDVSDDEEMEEVEGGEEEGSDEEGEELEEGEEGEEEESGSEGVEGLEELEDDEEGDYDLDVSDDDEDDEEVARDLPPGQLPPGLAKKAAAKPVKASKGSDDEDDGEGEGEEDGAEADEEDGEGENPEEAEDEDAENFPGWSSWLIGKFRGMFGEAELKAFVKAQEEPRPVTIRTNTLRIRRKELHKLLTKRGMNIQPLERWSKEGMQVFESRVPVGGTPEYLAGYYMVQSAVSFLPVLALGPLENERVLDMAAAPGGKTSHIAQLMRNTGILYANDSNKQRLKSLQANLHRLGVTNAIVCNYPGQYLTRIVNSVDRVLLDSPCTGTGVVSRDPSIKATKTHRDLDTCVNLQRKLLLAAIDCCDHKSATGGFVVYSTCSVLVEENEAIVDFVLKRRHVKLVETGLPFGRPGMWKLKDRRFSPNIKMCRRYFPHVHNLDGFFVAKFQKLAPGRKGREPKEAEKQ